MFYTKIGWNNKPGPFKPAGFLEYGTQIRLSEIPASSHHLNKPQSKIQPAILGEIDAHEIIVGQSEEGRNQMGGVDWKGLAR